MFASPTSGSRAQRHSPAATPPRPRPPRGPDLPGTTGIGLAILAVTILAAPGAAPAPSAADRAPRYEFRVEHSPDGIGKFYLGREIAHVMGHQAADWLERPEREQEEKTSQLIELLEIQPGSAIADLGCGTGYVSRPLARRTGPAGRVYGVDVQPEMLTLLTNTAARETITNIVPVLGTARDPRLPANTIDLILMVDVYHELEFPFEMTEAMVRALKPGGRLAFVEFRGEDPKVPIKLVHKMTEAQVRKEMAPHPLDWVATRRELPWQHVIIFRKRPAAASPAKPAPAPAAETRTPPQ